MGVLAEMVVAELIESVVGWLGSLVGLGGVAIGAIAVVLIALFYGHELANVLFRISRGLRMAVIVATALVAVLLAALYFDVIALEGSVGQLVDALASILNGVIH